jgi:hypothetical protein
MDFNKYLNTPISNEDAERKARYAEHARHIKTLQALSALYNVACHHPRCERELGGPENTNTIKEHICGCGVSHALQLARIAMREAGYR